MTLLREIGEIRDLVAEAGRRLDAMAVSTRRQIQVLADIGPRPGGT